MYSIYSERQTRTNSEYPDQTPQRRRLILVYAYQAVLDTLIGIQMDMFEILEQVW